MYGRNGSEEDYSFGFSGTEGWLGGTEGGSDTLGEQDYIGNDSGSLENCFDQSSVENDVPYNDGAAEPFEYDRPADPDEYSDSYMKALEKVSRHKEDQKSIWTFDFGSSDKADYGMPDWPRRRHIEKYKYGDISVQRPKKRNGRASLGAKIMFALWLVLGSVATVVFFSKREFWVLIWFFIQAITGICVYFGVSPKNRVKGFAVFIVADALLTAGVVALRFGNPAAFMRLADSMESIVGTIIASSIGAAFLTYGIAGYSRSKSRCPYIVDAMCLNCIRVTKRSSTAKCYCPIYEFFFNGSKYLVRPDSYNNLAPPKPGGMYKLRIDPLYPTDYFDIKRDGAPHKAAIILGGIWTLGFAAYFLSLILAAFH